MSVSLSVRPSQGIVRAIKDFQGPLKEHEVTIFVRRGGPNYQEGLRVMGEVGQCSLWQPSLLLFWVCLVFVYTFACFGHPGKTTGIPIHVFGTETHMTAIVGMALGHRPIPNQPPMDAHTANFLLNASSNAAVLSLQTSDRSLCKIDVLVCFTNEDANRISTFSPLFTAFC